MQHVANSLKVKSTSIRSKDNIDYWPMTCGEWGSSPQITWSNVLPACDLIDIIIVDRGGVGRYDKEGEGFIHLYLKNLPVKIGGIKAGEADRFAQTYGVENSGKSTTFYPFTPPHPPHYYTIIISAHNKNNTCHQEAELTRPFLPSYNKRI
jgi:phosphatidylethanolamine-binding protein (PEBP) family uncharacterized protein